jgi:hypothetical protein
MGIFTNQEVADYSSDLLVKSLKELFDTYAADKHIPYSVEFLPYKPLNSLSLMSQNVVITYRLYNAKPASMNGKPFSDDVRDVTPKDFKQETEDGIVFEASRQYMDTLLEFTVAAASTQYADEVTRVFTSFMILARTPLRQYGVSDLYFWERLADDAVQVKNDIYYTRTLRYFMRALYAMVTPQETIRQVAYVIEQLSQN